MNSKTPEPTPLKQEYTLPSDWPQYASPEDYAWKMASIPPDAIPADWSKQRPHNSYSPIYWYEDKQVKCVDCSCQFIFTKEEQRHWYEELHFPIYAEAVRCQECRAYARIKTRAERAEQLKHMEESAASVHPNEAFFKRPTLAHKRRRYVPPELASEKAAADHWAHIYHEAKLRHSYLKTRLYIVHFAKTLPWGSTESISAIESEIEEATMKIVDAYEKLGEARESLAKAKSSLYDGRASTSINKLRER